VQFGIADEHKVYLVSLFLRHHTPASNRESIIGIDMLVHAIVNESVLFTLVSSEAVL